LTWLPILAKFYMVTTWWVSSWISKLEQPNKLFWAQDFTFWWKITDTGMTKWLK
jgi:hypothetical protein